MFSWRRLTYISSVRSIIHVQLVQVQLPCLVFYHKLGKQSSRSTAGERWHSSLQWEIESLSHARCAHVPRTYISRNRPTKQTGADAWLAIRTICRLTWSIALYYFNTADINVGPRKRPFMGTIPPSTLSRIFCGIVFYYELPRWNWKHIQVTGDNFCFWKECVCKKWLNI